MIIGDAGLKKRPTVLEGEWQTQTGKDKGTRKKFLCTARWSSKFPGKQK